MRYPAIPLRELVHARPGTRNPASGGEGTFSYVDLESVDRDAKAIGVPKITRCSEAPSRARKVIKENDVLVAMVRPNLNAVAMVPPDLDNQIASTGFCVLRASTRVLPQFIYFAVRSPSFVDPLCGLVSGALYPAVTEGQVLSQTIPVPPLEEQGRIVDLLSRAENIVRMRREAEAKAKEIIPALFLEMFGDPGTNPKGWTIQTVSDVVIAVEYGTSTRASEGVIGVPMIRMGNVDMAGRLQLEDLKYVELEDSKKEKYRLRPGDILFNRTNSKELVGKTGIWRSRDEAVAASYFIRVRVNEERLAPDYLWALMNTPHMKKILFGMARGAIGQSNINSQELRSISLGVPPLSRQRTFSDRVRDCIELEQRQGIATRASELAFQSVLAGVFGE